MKASGSPCLLDQLSIICFKRCLFLRTYLTDLIHAVWLSGTIPSKWKKACAKLIHKKDYSNTLSNFRPITLETIPLEVFTSYLRNAMYSFSTTNNFIEHSIQKGFTPNLSGILENTAKLANIINKVRNEQCSLAITNGHLPSPYSTSRMLFVKFIIISYHPYLIITTSLNILNRSLNVYIPILKHQ